MDNPTNCRKCGTSCSRSMQISGVGPVCYTCFQGHKEKPFWEKLHTRMDKKIKDAKVEPGQVTFNDL
jgi:hypothetical protein